LKRLPTGQAKLESIFLMLFCAVYALMSGVIS